MLAIAYLSVIPASIQRRSPIDQDRYWWSLLDASASCSGYCIDSSLSVLPSYFSFARPWILSKGGTFFTTTLFPLYRFIDVVSDICSADRPASAGHSIMSCTLGVMRSVLFSLRHPY